MKSIEDAIGFHGHMCPGLAIGYRVAAFALERLGDRSEDEELVAIVENNSCAVDAVQVVTGCTFGKGNLIFNDYGKQVYTFIRRPSGMTLRIAVNWRQPEESAEEKAAWQKYMSGDRSESVLKVVHERKSRKIKSIIDAPAAELFETSDMPAAMPHEARIHQSIECEACGEKTMETRVRLLGGRKLCIPCFEKEL